MKSSTVLILYSHNKGDHMNKSPTYIDDEMKEDIARQIEEIKTTFDFKRVHELMTVMDWKWAGSVYAVPSVEKLKETADSLLEYVAKSTTFPYTSSATGGLKAYKIALFNERFKVYSIEVKLVFEAVKA